MTLMPRLPRIAPERPIEISSTTSKFTLKIFYSALFNGVAEHGTALPQSRTAAATTARVTINGNPIFYHIRSPASENFCPENFFPPFIWLGRGPLVETQHLPRLHRSRDCTPKQLVSTQVQECLTVVVPSPDILIIHASLRDTSPRCSTWSL